MTFNKRIIPLRVVRLFFNQKRLKKGLKTMFLHLKQDILYFFLIFCNFFYYKL